MGNRWGRISTVLPAALVVFLLGGCVTAAPEAAPPATVKPADLEPSSDPVTPDAPSPRLSATCEDLIPLQALHAEVGADVEAMAEGLYLRRPDDFALRQAGTLNCFWANKAPRPPWKDPDPNKASAELHVIPDARAFWERHDMNLGLIASPDGTFDGEPICFGTDYPAFPSTCSFNALVNSYWVMVEVTGIGDGTTASDDDLRVSARRLIEPLMKRIAQETETPPLWSPPAGATQPLSCEGALTDEQVVSITGVPDLWFGHNWDGPGTAPFIVGFEATGADRCHITFTDADSGIGLVTFLPGGAWAFRENLGLWQADGASPLALKNLRQGEQATIQCEVDAEEECYVDIILGEDWVQVLINGSVPAGVLYWSPEGMDLTYARSQIATLAETVLANLHARW